MINFFAILLIIFIGILLLFFKKRSLKKFINKRNIYSIKLNKNNKFSSTKKSFFYNHEAKKYSVFYKNSQRNNMSILFKGNTENKLKALKIAEELADKSTLPILRKGLRDISPEVVEMSALLIRKFK
ncbi:annexin [Prochlorococcus marinus str. MU1417]|nr:annexin [Prochlorococcus marinus CUG1417]MBW3074496.1 annexin [Prochlorococcus marinus str. MU1417]